MADIIQLRRDTAANWASENPVLADGETGFEKDTKLRKVGDGITHWNDLAYLSTETPLTIGTMINSAASKTTPVDADSLGLSDSAAGGVLKKLTWANLKAAINASLAKADVGLGNVDNTSDVNKPVSIAQAAADANVLSSAQSYADALVVGLLDDRGNYNASGNTFPTSGGSGSAGAIKKGDLWTISVAGTLGGSPVTAGDVVRALVDTPGQTAGNWAIAENNFGYVAAPLASPTFTGTPAAPTAAPNTNTTQLATTAFVAAAMAAGTGRPEQIQIAVSDETTALTTGSAKVTFRMPFAMSNVTVRLGCTTAPTGAAIIANVKEAGTTIFSTKPQIAAGSKTSVGGAVPGVVSDTSLADDAELTIDIDQVGSTIAGAGLKVSIIGTRT